MRRLLAPVVVVVSLWSAGCATAPVVRVHADVAGLARLAPAVVQPIDERGRAAQEDANRELERAHERATKAELTWRATRDEPRAADTAAILDVKIARAEAELRWQRALVEVARWHAAVAAAATERAKADLLNHAGQDVDLGAFVADTTRLRDGLAKATQRAAAARAGVDARERDLNAAKARYAQAHGIATR